MADVSEKGLYRRDGDALHPAPLTMGPWRPDAQHGGPPSGLLTAVCEEHIAESETLARMHVNLLTSIPLEPLRVASRRTVISRRVAHVEAELHHGNRKVAEGRALVLANGEIPEPDWVPSFLTAAPWEDVEPSVAPHWATTGTDQPFHRDGLEHRFLKGQFAEPGPAVDWVRLKQPVIEGVQLTGFQRVMGSVDVGSGISAVFDPSQGFGMINADLNVAFVAEPVGSWIRLEATSFIGLQGTGVGVTNVFDRHRLVAVASQSLLGTSFLAD